MAKIKVAIIGTGNIGTDLLMKLQRSEILECSLFTGHNPESSGLKLAQDMGVPISYHSIDAIINNPDCCEIVFDATSAKVHAYHAPILGKLNKFTIDLTPAKVGEFCVPVINEDICLTCKNVNLITCGGQASIPIAYAMAKVHNDIKYLELVASIASKSAGIGTRNNIDEFTQTTRDALSLFTGVKNTKAIIILNSAEPPITMRNTIYADIPNPNMDKIKMAVLDMVTKIQEYVPGYRLIVEPIFSNNRVTVTVEVKGSGDFLPEYAGNLDVITCAAIRIAEKYVKSRIRGEK